MSNTALACAYATLILQDNVDGAKIVAVCKAAGVDVSKGLATNFAKYASAADLDSILKNIAVGGGGAAAAAPAAGGKAAPAAAAPAEESEEDDDMGMDLFS